VDGFYDFLLDQERQFLEAWEPEFVDFIRELPVSHPQPDPSLMAEKAKPLLKRKPREWVRLLSETSDILEALRHLEMVMELVNYVQEEPTRSDGDPGIGRKIEFLLYTELEVLYRIFSRLQCGLNRLVRITGRHSRESLMLAESLRKSIEDWSKEFKKVRAEMTHEVNFGQSGLLESRLWEAIAAAPHKTYPADILARSMGARAEDYFALMRNEAAGTAKLLLVLYPKWKEILESVTQPSGSLT